MQDVAGKILGACTLSHGTHAPSPHQKVGAALTAAAMVAPSTQQADTAVLCNRAGKRGAFRSKFTTQHHGKFTAELPALKMQRRRRRTALQSFSSTTKLMCFVGARSVAAMDGHDPGACPEAHWRRDP